MGGNDLPPTEPPPTCATDTVSVGGGGDPFSSHDARIHGTVDPGGSAWRHEWIRWAWCASRLDMARRWRPGWAWPMAAAASSPDPVLAVAMTTAGPDPTMVVAASPPSGLTGQVVGPFGAGGGGGSWDPVSGLIAGRAWRPELPPASTALDAGSRRRLPLYGR